MLWRGEQTINGQVVRVDQAQMQQLDADEGILDDDIRLQRQMRDGRKDSP